MQEIDGMRLVVTSNRLPVKVSFQEVKREFKPGAGGLIAGRWNYLDHHPLNGTQQLESGQNM
jgi:hypothetical protein